MGKVIEMRTAAVSQTVISSLEALLARAKSGTVKGWMGVADIESEEPLAVICGSFADDDELAASVAAEAVQTLCKGPEREKKQVVAQAPVRPLPRGLRPKRMA